MGFECYSPSKPRIEGGRNAWERYSALVPEELEDLAQSLDMMDILSRIHTLRGRLVEIDQKKNPLPAEDVPMRTRRLKIVSSIKGDVGWAGV